ncbi:MAG: hypothetical protein RSB70_03955 [Clostridium sp.]
MYTENQTCKNDLQNTLPHKSSNVNNHKKNDFSISTSYKDDFESLIHSLKIAIDQINCSDYSKKSLGRFKERVERILSDIKD